MCVVSALVGDTVGDGEDTIAAAGKDTAGCPDSGAPEKGPWHL